MTRDADQLLTCVADVELLANAAVCDALLRHVAAHEQVAEQPNLAALQGQRDVWHLDLQQQEGIFQLQRYIM